MLLIIENRVLFESIGKTRRRYIALIGINHAKRAARDNQQHVSVVFCNSVLGHFFMESGSSCISCTAGHYFDFGCDLFFFEMDIVHFLLNLI
jgi:hypothetical protein